MATLADLESAIESLLRHPLGIGHYQLVRRIEEKAYEAYVFGLCLNAVRRLGVVPALCGICGTADPFIFRGGPGQIHSTRRNYGYASFTLNRRSFEIHAGVEFAGTSGMTHELDICIMRADDAQRCRTPDTRADPPAASLVAGWECKFLGGPIDKGLGRAFVGLMADMGTNPVLSGMCSNSTHSQLKHYFKKVSRPDPHFELSPLRPQNEQMFVSQVEFALKKMTAS